MDTGTQRVTAAHEFSAMAQQRGLESCAKQNKMPRPQNLWVDRGPIIPASES
jgi:hypothetical protein